MFSFHKPKVYRSSTGCCICRAKSSRKWIEEIETKCFTTDGAVVLCKLCNTEVSYDKKYRFVQHCKTMKHKREKAAGNKSAQVQEFLKSSFNRQTEQQAASSKKPGSSRFTDSKKYEDDFMDCFQLHERRSGEICNACVLLVKRWKKLPAGSERNWRHVVDARAGPGTKSLTKFKSKNKKKLKLKTESIQKVEKLIKKKHIYMKNDRSSREESPGALSDDITGEDFLSDMSGMSMPSSLAPSPTPSDDSAAIPSLKQRNKSLSPHRSEKGSKRRLPAPAISSFLDMTFWKREKVCCGTIFKGPYGAIIVDPRFLKPCRGCKNQQEKVAVSSSGLGHGTGNNTPNVHGDGNNGTSGMKGSKLIKSYSDSSSDSGYDESSNQGLGEGGHHRSNTVVRRSVGREEPSVVSNPLAEFAMHAANLCQQEVGEQPN